MDSNKNIVLIKGKHHFLGVFFTLIFIVACDDKNNKSEVSSQSTMPQSLLSATTQSMAKNADEVKIWNGQDVGFVASDNPVRNKVDALIALGKIYAAAKSYRSTSMFLSYNAKDNEIKKWRAHAAESINSDILNIYDSLNLVFKTNNIKPFKNTLAELAKPETIEIYTSASVNGSNNKENRQQKNKITQSSRVINASVLNAISVLAPSRKEYMLAGSVMLRESGKNLQQGLSPEGKITDPSKHQLGISQIDSALSLIPKFAINVCEEQREISQTYRESTNQIVEKLMSFDNQPTEANISDVYALAKQIETIAKSLPARDQDICK